MCEGWECYRKAEKLMTRGAVRGWIVVYKNKVCNGIIGYIEVGCGRKVGRRRILHV
jgi:hypothetical protein